MNIQELKQGDKIIWKNYHWGDLIGFRTLIIKQVMKTKIKTEEGIHLLKYEFDNVLIHTKENIESVKKEYKEAFKKNHKQRLKDIINGSELRLEAIKELIEEIETEINGE